MYTLIDHYPLVVVKLRSINTSPRFHLRRLPGSIPAISSHRSSSWYHAYRVLTFPRSSSPLSFPSAVSCISLSRTCPTSAVSGVACILGMARLVPSYDFARDTSSRCDSSAVARRVRIGATQPECCTERGFQPVCRGNVDGICGGTFHDSPSTRIKYAFANSYAVQQIAVLGAVVIMRAFMPRKNPFMPSLLQMMPAAGHNPLHCLISASVEEPLVCSSVLMTSNGVVAAAATPPAVPPAMQCVSGS